ncbi:MAG: hypothetical protein KGJ13_09250 [Patescibacteria group bacterium]|nr:hypothetical protein [Patescibacteria group bacterium]
MKDNSFRKFAKAHGWTAEDDLFFTKIFRMQQRAICSVFLQALNNYDGHKILEIANAVWHFKRFKDASFDPDRSGLILMKELAERSGEKFTIREVAQFLAAGKEVKTTEDGFSALRRKCREINFPLAESRKKRRK